MIWLVISSLVLFTGFLAYCIIKYKLEFCFSAYSKMFHASAINWWTAITAATAVLLMPPLLEISEGKMLQFTGFLAPIAMMLVALTPRWYEVLKEYRIHCIGVACAVAFIVIYTIMLGGVWIWLLVYLGIAGIATLICKRAWIMWLELAAYAMIYTVAIKMLI